MGLVSAESTIGDIIYIPLGCLVPIIHRGLEGSDLPGYIVVGEAYLDESFTAKPLK
jgi:hypothetical protein